METALRSMTKTSSFPQPPPAHQPPLLPLPAQAPSPQYSWAAPRAKKPSPKTASAPITVAAPSKKRVAPAIQEEWTETDSLYSVSPPPSCVPMPTSLLLTVAPARKAPTACAVEVSGGGAGVDVGATDELRRMLRL